MRARPAALCLALAAATSVPQTARAEVLDRVVAVLDEDAIFLSDLERRARPYLAEIEHVANAAEREQRRREFLRTLLDRMVDDALIRHAATRAHVTVNDEEVDQFVDRMARERGVTAEQIYEALQHEGVSRAEYRSHMEAEVLRLKVLQIRVRGRVHITENDLQEEYRRVVRESRTTSVLRIAHILVAVPQDATPERLVALRERANDIVRRARAGEDFAALATQLSDDDATRSAGGDLGEVQPGTLPGDLETTLGRMAPGEVSDVLPGSNGFEILRLVSRAAPTPPPFADVRDRLYAMVLNREMLRHQRIYLRELRRNAAIEIRL